ncbi:MAG: zf-TFIIB domain-containing protein [Deltaproteobacteria bacterium]|nr:zf-TFIIB domain-containing protein [Deltaproteobacteria bacterium]
MPIYEYRCPSCHDDFEVSQKISDAPLSECPKCRGTLEKLISQSSFVLKGSGWYMTDYARKGGAKEGAAKESAKEGGGCAASGSKPACAGCPGASD